MILTAQGSAVSTPQDHHCCLWAFMSVWISVCVINNHCWVEGKLSQQHLSLCYWWRQVYSLTTVLRACYKQASLISIKEKSLLILRFLYLSCLWVEVFMLKRLGLTRR